ncbi:MAG: hypothetical protein ACTSYC_05355 [Promethearchaeota archaeon]
MEGNYLFFISRSFSVLPEALLKRMHYLNDVQERASHVFEKIYKYI